MNKKFLMGLLISFIVSELMASVDTPFSPVVSKQKLSAEMQDSPMTQFMKERKTKKSSVPLAKSALQRFRILEGVIVGKDAEIAMLKEKIAESEKIIVEQIEEINTLRQILSNVQNALIRK